TTSFMIDSLRRLDDITNADTCSVLPYLFIGSDTGDDQAAAMYSLIGTCKLNSINPRAYLEYVLTPHITDYIITRIDELLPWNVADKLKSTAIPPSTT
ncbi:MAG: transposase domain-containing protein, partial [Burkholderia sp.]